MIFQSTDLRTNLCSGIITPRKVERVILLISRFLSGWLFSFYEPQVQNNKFVCKTFCWTGLPTSAAPVYAHMTHNGSFTSQVRASFVSKFKKFTSSAATAVVTCQCKLSCIVAGAFIKPCMLRAAGSFLDLRRPTPPPPTLSFVCLSDGSFGWFCVRRGVARSYTHACAGAVHLHANGRRSALAAKSPCRRDASNAD